MSALRAFRNGWFLVLLAGIVASVLAGCTGGPILANEPVVRPSPPPTPVPAASPRDPMPIVFPRDDSPHDRLMEWWYYTGHLRDTASGRRYGFEFVIFRAERGDLPVSWASHLALTDEASGRFSYSQRSEIGPQVDVSPRDPATGAPTGFSFAISGDPATLAPGTTPWTMSGSNGTDRLRAVQSAAEAAASGAGGGFGLDLRLRSTKPPALHDGDGFIDFGLAGGSYYYSRTRMTATGTLIVNGQSLRVDGIAWFDHQWGDFISVGGGGWDWFALNLYDGTDITLSLVRAADGSYPLVYGTLVDPAGIAHHLDRTAFRVDTLSTWTSPRTGATYPAGWRITIPSERLSIELTPSVADQELDTRQTSGVVYWEGSQRVTAAQAGRSVAGQAYVELTGYAK